MKNVIFTLFTLLVYAQILINSNKAETTINVNLSVIIFFG